MEVDKLTLAQAQQRLIESKKIDTNKPCICIESALQEYPNCHNCEDFFKKFNELKDQDVSDHHSTMTIICDVLLLLSSMTINTSRCKCAEVLFSLFTFTNNNSIYINELCSVWKKLSVMKYRDCKGRGPRTVSVGYEGLARRYKILLSQVKNMIKYRGLMLTTACVIADCLFQIPAIEQFKVMKPDSDQENNSCIIWQDCLTVHQQKQPVLIMNTCVGMMNYDGLPIESELSYKHCTIKCPASASLTDQDSTSKGVVCHFDSPRQTMFALLSALEESRPKDIFVKYNKHSMLRNVIKEININIYIYIKRASEYAKIPALDNKIVSRLVPNVTRTNNILAMIGNIHRQSADLYEYQELRYFYPYYMMVMNRISMLCKVPTYGGHYKLVKCASEKCQSGILFDNVPNGHSVQCICSHSTCIKCEASCHGNISCDLVDDEMKDIISSVTIRPCPSCASLADRGTGCRHITCPTCRVHYCWDCNLVLENGMVAVADHMSEYHGGDYGIVVNDV